jgi:hypothetical protein
MTIILLGGREPGRLDADVDAVLPCPVWFLPSLPPCRLQRRHITLINPRFQQEKNTAGSLEVLFRTAPHHTNPFNSIHSTYLFIHDLN